MEVEKRSIKMPELKPLERELYNSNVRYIPLNEIYLIKEQLDTVEVAEKKKQYKQENPLMSWIFIDNPGKSFSFLFIIFILLGVFSIIYSPREADWLLIVFLSSLVLDFIALIKLINLRIEVCLPDEWQVAPLQKFLENKDYKGDLHNSLCPCFEAGCRHPLLNFEVKYKGEEFGPRFLYVFDQKSRYCIDFWETPPADQIGQKS